MNGDELRSYRKKKGWTQQQVADLLNGVLDRKYGAADLGRWENGKRRVPPNVAETLTQLMLEDAFPSELPPLEGEHEQPPGEDTPPPPPDGETLPAGQAPLPGGGAYARVCEELWEMVATGVGMVGALTGSQALQTDGRIILADKQALGRAYGKLAQTNQTFQRMLVGMTSSGAWLEVAMVSGITAGKLMRNHQDHRRARLEAAEGVNGDGDGRVVPLTEQAA